MTVTLYRIDAAQNMRRYYQLEVAQDLFGYWLLIREWGRIGRRGRCQIASFRSKTEADGAMQSMLMAKMKRGYVGPPDASYHGSTAASQKQVNPPTPRSTPPTKISSE